MGPLLAPYLRGVLYELDRVAGAGDKVKRGLRVLRSFLGALKITYADIELGLDIDPEVGSADSGDMEIDLPTLFVAIGEAAEERKSAVAVLIDEIQYFSAKELGALIMAMHKIQQRQLPVVLLGAGLPILPGLAGESKSYAERLFSFPEVGALSEEDAAKALRDPALAAGVVFEQSALDEAFRLTKGYPYFLQEWGYQSWNQAPTHRTGDIADMLHQEIRSLGPVRAKLIKKGMVYSPAHGDMAFTVPLFDEFMRRAIPTFTP